MSAKNWLRFFSIQIFSFAGIFKGKNVKIEYPEGFKPTHEIDPHGGIFILFPPDHRYVEASGDQGTGKTSLKYLFMEAAGHITLDRFINKKDDDKKYEQTFEGVDGCLYKVKATKTQFDLFEIKRNSEGVIEKDNRGRQIEMKSPKPKELVKKLVGPAGISPMEVAAKKPEEQVEWFRTVVSLSPEQKKFESELNANIMHTYGSRKTHNAKTAELQKLLENNEYYKEHEKWINYFKTTNFDNIEEDIKNVQLAYSRYSENQHKNFELNDKIKNTATEIEQVEENIKALQARLQRLQNSYKELQDENEKVELYLLENKSIVQDNENVMAKVKEASEFNAKKQAFESMVKLLEDYNRVSDTAINLNSQLEEYRELKKRFLAEVAPKVEGLEIITPDDEDPRHGAYYKGSQLEILCESEQWEWYTELCKQVGIRVMYIENVSSLGSGSIEKFNEFILNGGYVFATKMDREQKDLRITFNTKIPA